MAFDFTPGKHLLEERSDNAIRMYGWLQDEPAHMPKARRYEVAHLPT